MKKPKKPFAYAWIVIGFMVLLVIVCGVVGMHRTAAGVGVPLNPLQHVQGTVKVFKGDYPFPLEQKPWAPESPFLRLARLLGPWVLLLASGKLGTALFATQWDEFLARFRKGHVLICGAGHKGRSLAEQFIKRGKKVTVIEIDTANDALMELRFMGAIVLLGNGADSARLERAGAHLCTHVFAVTRNDETNLEIALEVEDLRKKAATAKQALGSLHLYAHIQSFKVRELFEKLPPFNKINRQTKLEARLFDCLSIAAQEVVQKIVEKVDCHRSDDLPPSFLLCGEGHFLMEFLRQLIINAHFGNARNPRITVLTTDGEWEELFKRQYNSIPLVADVVFVKMCQARIDYALVESLGNLGALEAAVFSTSQDGETLEMAEAFSQLTASSGEKQRAAAGNVSAKSLYACLLPSSSLSELMDRMPLRATVVNVAELGCSYGLLDAEFDREARTLHDKYVADQQKKVEVKRSPLASLSWGELPEFYRDSNRSAALHHRIKRGALKMIGEQGKMDLRERLSKAEHDRWMAERIMNGWRHNPKRNDLARLHPDIVPYEQLSEETKGYDRNNVDGAWNATG